MQGLAGLKAGGLAHHLAAAVGHHAEATGKDVLGWYRIEQVDLVLQAGVALLQAVLPVLL